MKINEQERKDDDVKKNFAAIMAGLSGKFDPSIISNILEDENKTEFQDITECTPFILLILYKYICLIDENVDTHLGITDKNMVTRDKFNAKFDEINERFDSINSKFHNLINEFDNINKRLNLIILSMGFGFTVLGSFLAFTAIF